VSDDATTMRGNGIAAALWPGGIGALAVLYAVLGDGWPARRSAIAWMMGSWAARLTVQAVYASAGWQISEFRFQISNVTLLVMGVLFSSPAYFASRNPAASLSLTEMAAAALWAVAFAGETTADRQLLRFRSAAAHDGRVCRAGVWRVLPRAHDVFEVTIWIAFALFAAASPWGWTAFACPAAMLYLAVTRRC
jgi:steroid 5-alpha reductase family enzyme